MLTLTVYNSNSMLGRLHNLHNLHRVQIVLFTGWTDSQLEGLGLLASLSELMSKLFSASETTQLKLQFASSVLTQFFKVWAVSAGHAFLPWYYVLTMPPLIAWRVYTYTQQQWQYFCLDYCYFGNLAIFLILLFVPGDPELFILQFCIANGLLYTGAFSFRNSLVFHSVDKMTSTYIHSAPVLLVFGIRWFPEQASAFWHTSFPQTFLEWNVKWNILAPLAFSAAHAIFYTVLVYGILKPKENIITSFRYLKAKKSTKAIFGPNPSFISFLMVQFGIVLVMTGVTVLTYTYFYLHLLQILVLVVVVTWNGANFYVDVFRVSLSKTKKS